MHEAALAQQVLQITEQHAQQLVRVDLIRLRIGELASIDCDALRFALECALSQAGSTARLEIETEAAMGRCNQCHTEYAMQTLYDPCPACGSFRHTMIAGTSMVVAAIEGLQNSSPIPE
ncbi:hydrogenase maturation nickel metallochaperone HypA [Chitinibacter sp. S2-10]|uniref:hydrogenase maturation nickel metallochaperone HypA/HybF n=1 Tax=Chitinibacter sp. S2-10 TaxID=3373597 RepID=UPI003977621D